MLQACRKSMLFCSIVVLSISPCVGQEKLKADKALLKTINKNFVDAANQYKVLMKNLPADRFPKTYHAELGQLETSGSDWWCSGFYPGALLNLYTQTKDEALRKEALRMLGLLEKEKNNTNTHDLGFMMYCSFGNANRLAPKEDYKEILVTSAQSLSTRFN